MQLSRKFGVAHQAAGCISQGAATVIIGRSFGCVVCWTHGVGLWGTCCLSLLKRVITTSNSGWSY